MEAFRAPSNCPQRGVLVHRVVGENFLSFAGGATLNLVTLERVAKCLNSGEVPRQRMGLSQLIVCRNASRCRMVAPGMTLSSAAAMSSKGTAGAATG